MTFKFQIKNIAVEVISLLYILLFIYAEVSKLLDFENFQVQLGQSPLLSAFAHPVSWLVLLSEIIISVLLAIPKLRRYGLHAAFCLMSMFTAYIFIMLHYSSFVPCSCGGILEKMSWNVHLTFNIFFIILAIIALLLENSLASKKGSTQVNLMCIRIMAVSLVTSVGIIVLLFLASEEIMQHENPFIRRYPQHPVDLRKRVDLKYNSYYFAGYTNGKIYLGNYSDPLHLIAFDNKLKQRERIQIILTDKTIKYNMVKIFLKDSYFYLTDGTMPFILRGKISDWKITKKFDNCPYFSLAEPIDSVTIALRSNRGESGINVLGIYTADNIPKKKFNTELLQKQIDGVFDTDGILLSDAKQRIVYLYYYRNEFLLADKKTNLLKRSHTIDTISHAQIKVASLKERGEKKMAAPPLIVNKSAVICQNILFVQSKVKGRYEPKDLWKDADIIDVYNISKNSYLMSFAIYKNEGKSLRYFYMTENHLYVLLDTYLQVYELDEILKKEMRVIKSSKISSLKYTGR